ncbi:MAG: hypothetical protein VW378_05955 [bacterium]
MSDTGHIGVDESNPDNVKITLLLAVMLIFMVVIVLWSIFFFKGMTTEILNQKQLTPKVDERQSLELYEESRLSSYSWVDQAKGIVQIPIREAVLQVIDDYQ